MVLVVFSVSVQKWTQTQAFVSFIILIMLHHFYIKLVSGWDAHSLAKKFSPEETSSVLVSVNVDTPKEHSGCPRVDHEQPANNNYCRYQASVMQL